ncbi:MAG: preprotein translocase subunit SecG [Dokdonella sp.]
MSIVANIFYVLIAIAMTVLILLQRGAGADAGSGFGGGASATVFGARGSANFLSRSTAVLAGLFFLLSLGMGMYLARSGADVRPVDDLGVMSGVAPATKPAPSATPSPTGVVAPVVAPAASGDKPAPASATTTDKPAPAADKPAASTPKDGGKNGK